jgi:putative DNA primase/helicase
LVGGVAFGAWLMSASENINAFRQAMLAHGLEPPEAIEPGKIHRFPGVGKPRGDDAGRCRLFDDGFGGWFQDLSSGLKETWQAQRDKPSTPEEREAFRRKCEADRRKLEAEAMREYEATAARAVAFLEGMQATGDAAGHPYAVAKTVPFGPLVRRGAWPQQGWADALIVPLIDVDGKVWSLEAINSDGRKAFLKGTKKPGIFHPLGELRGAGTILVGEGLATVAAAYEATGLPCAAAMDAGSLAAVAKALREAFPQAQIVLLADNDIKPDGSNPGLQAATQAAQAVGGVVAVPAMDGRKCDFWDLWDERGVDAVSRPILLEVNKSPALPTLPAFPRAASYTSEDSSYTQAENPTPSCISGGLTCTDEKGNIHLLIESKAAKITAGWISGEFAYCASAGAWHVFNGACWMPTDQSEPYRKITELLYLATNPLGFRPLYLNGIVTLLTRGGLLPLARPPAGKIPFSNGLLDMADGTLKPITRDSAYTWSIPHEHKEGSDCAFFTQWLRSALEYDEGTVGLMRAFIAACLAGRSDLQKFLFLLGPGGTGKSTFLRLLFAILGESNCATTDLRNLEQNRFETAALYGKRLVAVSDAGRYVGAVDVLKALTGQDALRREEKNKQQAGTFIYDGMVVIASNEHLAATDYTSGLERRRLVVRFDRRIGADEKAKFAAAGGEGRLHSEIPAIINWALELTRDQVTQAFMSPPQKSVDAAFDALTAQNPVAEWISENLIAAPGVWIQVGGRRESKPFGGGSVIFEDADARLYPNYLRWCHESKREALALRRFRETAVDMLKTLGIDVVESRRGGGQGIQGVKIRGENDLVLDHPTLTREKCRLEAAPILEVQEVRHFEPTQFVINRQDDAELF